MAKCVNCGMEIDTEWSNRGYFMNSDGDFVCSGGCERSHTAQILKAADLPHNEDDITFCSRRNTYDP